MALGAARVAGDEMIDRLIGELGRLSSALAVQPATVLEALTPLLVGHPPSDGGVQLQRLLSTGEGEEGAQGAWFPEIEFDESMESREKWPDPRSTISSTPNGGNGMGSHEVVGETVARSDGQPMFQAGTTAPRPVSGTE